ncbi:MAG: hypothetical protein ACHQ52_05970 [Candidatus Eisenbacteria bacterium]
MSDPRNRMNRPAAIALTLALVWVGLAAATARADLSGVGGSLGLASPQDLDGTASLGVHAEVTTRNAHLQMVPNMRYWSVDGISDVAPNFDVAYHFQPDRHMTPYLGGGLGVNFVHNDRLDRSDTDLGINMIGGLRFPGDRNHYFLEGRFTASDVSQVSVQTGITFGTP